MEPQELRQRLRGIFSFPVTPFQPDGELDVPALREHIEFQLSTRPGGIFVGCGTGEGFSLDFEEQQQVFEAAVDVVTDGTPVIAGVGYSTRMATRLARSAEAAGVDGILVLPPYLIRASQEGLYEHYRTIAEATSLGTIMYQREPAIIQPRTARQLADLRNIIGLKDGEGDLENLTQLHIACEERLSVMSGLPTAELTAPAYFAVGVESYSSAILNFVPEVALAFYTALINSDGQRINQLQVGFFRPFAELRDTQPNYAITLVKAGVGLRRTPVGNPRCPLTPPDPKDIDRLEELIETGLELAQS